jgi:hypothetical protein
VGSSPRSIWSLVTADDVRDHPVQVASIVVVLLLTLVAPPVALGVTTVRRVRATEAVTGTVVEVARFAGKRSTTWEYTFDYRVEGTTFRDSVRVRREGPRFEKGGTLRVYVDPGFPARAYVSRQIDRAWLALTFFFWGVASLLLCLRGVPTGRDLLRPRYAWAFALVFTPLALLAPVSLPPERGWLVGVLYAAVLAVTSGWLWVQWRRRTPDAPV